MMQKEGEGGFLFISHSHHDMDKVRPLRNKLEEAGFEPLCFYLKCLDDSTEELDDLIKREIDARQWFVYARSSNSESSDYVQFEREWRKREESKNKQELEWDLEANVSVDEVSKMLIRDLKIFILSSPQDDVFCYKLSKRLFDKDFNVYYFNGCDSETESIDKPTLDIIRNYGTIIVLLSHNSIKSPAIKDILIYCNHFKLSLIPIIIDDVNINESSELKFLLGEFPVIFNDLKRIKNENDLDMFIEETVNKITYDLDSKFKDL